MYSFLLYILANLNGRSLQCTSRASLTTSSSSRASSRQRSLNHLTRLKTKEVLSVSSRYYTLVRSQCFMHNICIRSSNLEAAYSLYLYRENDTLRVPWTLPVSRLPPGGIVPVVRTLYRRCLTNDCP